MKEYQIKIREILSRIVTVEAELAAAAIDKVEDEYNDSKHVLDADDFQDVRFEVIE